MSVPPNKNIDMKKIKQNLNKNIVSNKTQNENCLCDTSVINKFEKLWNDGNCIRSTTNTEERITCWDGNKQYISIKPIETKYTD